MLIALKPIGSKQEEEKVRKHEMRWLIFRAKRRRIDPVVHIYCMLPHDGPSNVHFMTFIFSFPHCKVGWNNIKFAESISIIFGWYMNDTIWFACLSSTIYSVSEYPNWDMKSKPGTWQSQSFVVVEVKKKNIVNFRYRLKGFGKKYYILFLLFSCRVSFNYDRRWKQINNKQWEL